MTTAIAILIALMSGLSPSLSDVVYQSPALEPVIIYVSSPAIIDCQEDEDWAAVHYKSLDGVEDMHGVTRACRSRDQLIDYAIEIAIQQGVLMYVPSP